MSPFASADWASIGRQVADHLWQSTLFATVAGLLTLSLRNNHARTRYWLWMAASVKFLLPFAAIVAVGGSFGPSLAPRVSLPRIPAVAEQIAQPFTLADRAIVVPVAGAPGMCNPLPGVIVAVWFCGFAAILVDWQRRWRRVAAIVRASPYLRQGREVEALRRMQWNTPPRLPKVVSSDGKMEPGIFGIFRPVLWLPKGIGDHLSEPQLEAVLAHELCHARRRDNLLSAIHMVVEAVFWFHPLVWWLGARLEEERERACDEEALQMGGEPQAYAEAILKVCEFYLTSPLSCVAGVTGADLRKRIEAIVTNRSTRRLSVTQKALLASAGLLTIAGPIAFGLAQTAVHLPEFEVASVKPAKSNVIGMFTYPGGRVVCSACPLRYLMMEAFHLQAFQISGGPHWIDDEGFDIEAKPPASSASAKSNPLTPKLPPSDEQRQMLQALLINRFQLKYRRSTTEGQVYVLTVGHKQLRLQPAKDENDFPWAVAGGGGLRGINITMSQLAARASGWLDHPVLDRTGLEGSFDFDYRLGEGDSDSNSDLVSSIITSLNALGLSLKDAKGPVETVVIDDIEKPLQN